MSEATGIIPARYGSKRFPGKPLAVISGKPMIQRVYEQAKKAKLLKKVLIATDDERIRNVSKAFGAEVQMTSFHHRTGTERVAEVAQQLDASVIINIQGDEPLVKGEMIDDLVQSLQDKDIPMATLARKVRNLSLIQNTDIVKVVVDRNGYALYFSRSALPFRAAEYFWQHIGIYGYQKNFLIRLQQWPPSRLERCEELEQLRVLENGYRIKIVPVKTPTMSVDTPSDLLKVEHYLQKGTND